MGRMYEAPWVSCAYKLLKGFSHLTLLASCLAREPMTAGLRPGIGGVLAVAKESQSRLHWFGLG